MGRRNNYSRKDIVNRLKKSNSKTDFMENNQSMYLFTRKNFPELIEKFFPKKKRITEIPKSMIENPPTKSFIVLKIKGSGNRSEFSKNNHKLYLFAEKFYPGLLDGIFPKIKTWKDLDLSENELLKEVTKFKNRTHLIKKGGSIYFLCLNKYPKLIDKVFPIKEYVFENKNEAQIKREIISKMKKSVNRSRFKWDYATHYKYMKSHFPYLIDIYLPKLERYSQSVGELSTRSFLERLFKTKLPNTRPEWLINPRTGKRMELDGYDPVMMIAFEYGDHSDIRVMKKNPAVLKKDKLKKSICRKRGVKLIQITKDIFKDKGAEESLKRQLWEEVKRLKIQVSKSKIMKESFKIVYPKGYKYTKDFLWKEARKHSSSHDFLSQSKYYMACYRIGEHQNIKKVWNK